MQEFVSRLLNIGVDCADAFASIGADEEAALDVVKLGMFSWIKIGVGSACRRSHSTALSGIFQALVEGIVVENYTHALLPAGRCLSKVKIFEFAVFWPGSRIGA